MSNTPVYITIAGSDCSAGAGLQADLKAGFALGCYPLTAVTCVVNEIPGLVDGIVPMEADFVAAQLRLCLSSFPVKAIKTGMLYSPEIVRAVVAELKQFTGAVVVDPVMIATAGEALILQEAIAVYEQELIPHTTLLTPNLDELSRLCGCEPIRTFARMQEQATALCAKYGCAILAKGGHLEGTECIDLLVQPGGKQQSWSHPRTEGVSTHGTGCTLSSAITAYLAHGLPLEQAVEKGLTYVTNAIAHSHRLGHIDALNHHGR
ncbi:MAG: bifunctional hydroxymethylpyrimidine kinase/phosphomethylpyrimidine kinase [Akkermansia sp.]|nr:bifunctional hydroxymethylpyrimidine kinase/phosphomethylpyrimidine kinase [Akkermansia sp.]